MRNYIIRRLILLIPTFFIVTVIVFLLIRLIPGSIVDIMMAEMMAQGGGSADRASIEHALGMDVPMHTQYVRWLGIWPQENGDFSGLFQGNLGRSLWRDTAVTKELMESIPITFEIGILAILVALIIAVPIGIYSAIRQDTKGDYIGRTFAILCIALPSFWLGTLVVVFPSIWWGWSPSMELIDFFDDPLGNLLMFIIPSFILGMVLSGVTMRMTRTMMLEVLRQDYIRTAWSKGLRERTVITRHALKNALIPVITIVGLQVPILIGGSVVIETIFCLPGVGRLLLEALNKRDYPIVSGVNVFLAMVMIGINLAIDIAYGYLDPRVHYK